MATQKQWDDFLKKLNQAKQETAKAPARSDTAGWVQTPTAQSSKAFAKSQYKQKLIAANDAPANNWVSGVNQSAYKQSQQNKATMPNKAKTAAPMPVNVPSAQMPKSDWVTQPNLEAYRKSMAGKSQTVKSPIPQTGWATPANVSAYQKIMEQHKANEKSGNRYTDRYMLKGGMAEQNALQEARKLYPDATFNSWEDMADAKKHYAKYAGLGDVMSKYQDDYELGQASASVWGAYEQREDLLSAADEETQRVLGMTSDTSFHPELVQSIIDEDNAKTNIFEPNAALYGTYQQNRDVLDVYEALNRSGVIGNIDPSGYDNATIQQLGLTDMRDAYITQEQLMVFNHYVNSGQYDAAREYLSQIRLGADVRYTENESAELEEYALDNPVLAFLKARWKTLEGAANAIPQQLSARLGGNTSMYSPLYQANMTNSVITGTQSEALNKKYGGVASFLYNTGTSMVDNMLASIPAVLTGNPALTMLIMGSEAASADMYNQMQMGVDPTSAANHAAVTGFLEFATEKLGVDALLGDPKGAIGKYLLKNAGSEAVEEGITGVAAPIVDWIFDGYNSPYWQEVVSRVADGEDIETAKRNATGSAVKDIGEGMLSGFISGGGQAGIGIATHPGSLRSIRTEGAQTLLERNREITETVKANEARAQEEGVSEQEAESLKAQNETLIAERTRNNEKVKKLIAKINGTPTKAESGQKGSVSNPEVEKGLSIKGMDKDGNFIMSDDSSRGYADVDLTNMPDTAELASEALHASEDYGVSPGVYYGSYRDGVNVEQYNYAARAIMSAGYAGGSLSAVMDRDVVSNAVPQEMAEALYVAAANKGKADTDSSRLNAKLATPMPKDGAVTVDDDAMAALLDDDKDSTRIKLVEAFTDMSAAGVFKSSGLKIEFFAGKANADGVYESEQGSYNPTTNTIRVDINAGRNSVDSTASYAVGQVVSHELTHAIKAGSPKQFSALQTYVADALAKRGESLDAHAQQIMSDYAKAGNKIDISTAMEEVVAQACEMALRDSQFASNLVKSNRTLAEKIRDIIKDIAGKIKAAFSGSRHITDMSKAMENDMAGLVEIWDRALAETLTGESGVTETDGGHVVQQEVADIMEKAGYEMPEDRSMFSIRTIDEWANSMKAAGTPKEIMDAAVKNINGITMMILEDATLREVVPHGKLPKTRFGPLRSNMEYTFTLDMDGKCTRTLVFASVRDSVQEKIHRRLTEKEARNLIELMRAYGYMIPCTYCYVENKRMLLSDQYNSFLNTRESVLAAEKDSDALKKMYSYNARKNSVSNAAQIVFDRWRANRNSEYRPTVKQLFDAVCSSQAAVMNWLDDQYGGSEHYATDSESGYRDYVLPMSESNLLSETLAHFGVDSKGASVEIASTVAQWVYDKRMNMPHNIRAEDSDASTVNAQALDLHNEASKYAMASSSARNADNYEPYVDQVRNISVEDKQNMIAQGGLRKHSSNDFRLDYIIDYIQAYTDMATDTRGGTAWTGHTYSKDTDFARIFAPTRDRINISIAMNGDNASGITENNQEGAVWEEARKIREKYPNVGIMAMVTNNDQLSYALNSPWIDMIIPFHASGMKKELYYNVMAWLDYSSKQNERPYNRGEMARQLKEIGIKTTSSMKAAQVKRLFMENIGYKTIEGRDADGNPVVKRPHFLPGPTTDTKTGAYTPGHNNDVHEYFRLCREYGVFPRFYGVQVQDENGNVIDVTRHPQYLKLIKETARTDTPQETIQAEFDLEYAMTALKEFKGYGLTEDTAYNIANEFVEKYVDKNRPLGWLPETALRVRERNNEYAQQVLEEMREKGMEGLTKEEQRKTLVQPSPSVNPQSEEKHSLRTEAPLTDREIVGEAMESAAKNDAELAFMRRYQDLYAKINKDAQKIREQQSIMDGADPKSDEYKQANARRLTAQSRMNRNAKDLTKLEETNFFKSLAKAEVERATKRVRAEEDWKAAEEREGLIWDYERKLQGKDERFRQYKAESERAAREAKENADWDVAYMRKAEEERRNRLEERLAQKDERFRQYKADRKESATRAKYLERVEREANALTELLTTNTDKKHVPEALKGPLGDLLLSINRISKQQTKGGEPTRKDLKLSEKLRRVQEVLRNQSIGATNPDSVSTDNLYLPDDIAEELGEIIKAVEDFTMNNPDMEPLFNMSTDRLQTLSKFLVVLHKAINAANRTFVTAGYAKISELGSSTNDEMYGMRKVSDRTNGLTNYLNWDMAVPIRAFEKMGAAAKALFKGLRNGAANFAFKMAEIEKFGKATWNAKQAEKWGYEVHEFELTDPDTGETNTLKITTSQIMSLYLLSKRQQAMKHIEADGIKVREVQKGNKYLIRQTEPYKLSAEDVRTITGVLTEEQRSICQKISGFFAMTSDWGNEISMKRFGYNAFTERNYFPIATDEHSRKAGGTDPKQRGADLYRLLNMSFTKPLSDKVKNALVVDDVFATFTDHASDMAKYNAFALPVLDVIRWYNYNDGKNKINTRNALDHAFGKAAGKYIETFISDLSGVTRSGERTNIADWLTTNAKVSSVVANLSVVLKQGTSIFRAAYELPSLLTHPWRLFAPGKAIGLKSSYDEMISRSGIARWKSLGYFDINVGRPLEQRISKGETIRDKFVEFGSKGAEYADKLTFVAIWDAVKADVGKTMDKGSDAYWEAVVDRFEDVIYKTQVVDSVMTRSQQMRSKTKWDKAMTAFMSEPVLGYNVLMDALSRANSEKRRTGRISGQSWKRLSLAFTAHAMSGLAAALVGALVKAYRDEDDYKTFGEKYRDSLFGEGDTIIQKILSSEYMAALNPLETIPLYNEFRGYFTGDDSSVVGTAVSNLNKAYTETRKILSGDTSASWQKTLAYDVRALSSLSGMPVYNIGRDAYSLWNSIVGGVAPYLKFRVYGSSASEGYEAYYDAILAGDTAEMKRLERVMEINKRDNGKTHLEGLGDGLTAIVKKEYLSGALPYDKAEEILITYCGRTKTGSKSAYHDITAWEYKAATNETSYSMYTPLRAALIAGDDKAVQEAYGVLETHYDKSEKDVDSQIASIIRDAFEDGDIDRETAEKRMRQYTDKNARETREYLDREGSKKKDDQ